MPGVSDRRREYRSSFSRGGARLLRAPVLPGEALDLAEVIDIVSGEHLDDARDRFFAPLGVQAIMIPLLSGQRLQQGEVALAQRAEHLKRAPRVLPGVIRVARPDVLIEGLDRRAILAKDHAHPVAAHELCFGEVRKNLSDRPRARRRAFAQLLAAETEDQALKFFRSGLLYAEGFSPLDVAQDSSCVLLWCLLHASVPSLARNKRTRKPHSASRILPATSTATLAVPARENSCRVARRGNSG